MRKKLRILYIMTTKDKALKKVLESNGKNIQFSDFVKALKAAGYEKIRQDGTSHAIWAKSGKQPMNIQPAKDGKAKPYQIKQFQKEERG